MASTFVHEAACYKLLHKYAIGTASYIFIESENEFPEMPFKDGQPVVLKAVVDDVWHKSDLGLVKFVDYSPEIVRQARREFYMLVPQKEKWRGLLVCQKVAFLNPQLPAEILLSIKNDFSCGPVVTLGFGGIYTELWGKELKDGVLNFPVKLTSVEMAFAELTDHLLGKILLGKIRQGKELVSADFLKDFLQNVWNLAENLENEQISLLEINPLVVDENGKFLAIDAVGEKIIKEKSSMVLHKCEISKTHKRALFNPKTVVIAGVSSKKKAFGNIILDNFKNSDIPAQNIRVIKPGSTEFEGFATINSINDLQEQVDILVLAVPAQGAISVIEEACISGRVKIIYLVAGGIGDGADHSGLKEKLVTILNECVHKNRPLIVGPNSLGIILSHLKVNTLFIPREKLPVTFYPGGNVGLIAQSGAFFITRISKNNLLPIKYGFCIGNQIDVSAIDILQSMADEAALDVIALYLEGAPQGDALSFARIIQKISNKKKIIIYRGGRSTQGMKAAAGHTGALATDYGIEKKLLQNAGALVFENFSDFENAMLWYSAYPAFKVTGKQDVAVVSNAGYESVASADGIGSFLAKLGEGTKAALKETLSKHYLTEIVSPANPLDITPMASDDVYFECAANLLKSNEADILVIGIVPLSVMIETKDQEKMQFHARRLKKIIGETGKYVAVIIDAGNDYLPLKESYLKNGIPVFNSIQEIFKLIKQ